jgi:hypothetical protein
MNKKLSNRKSPEPLTSSFALDPKKRMGHAILANMESKIQEYQ